MSKTAAQILREYKDAVKDIHAKHRKALDIAAARYAKQSIALLQSQAGATVGKPSRSKAGGTRSRS